MRSSKRPVLIGRTTREGQALRGLALSRGLALRAVIARSLPHIGRANSQGTPREAGSSQSSSGVQQEAQISRTRRAYCGICASWFTERRPSSPAGHSGELASNAQRCRPHRAYHERGPGPERLGLLSWVGFESGDRREFATHRSSKLPRNSPRSWEFPVLIGRTSSRAAGQPHRHPADQGGVPRHAPSQPASQHAVPVTVQKQFPPSAQRQPTTQPPCSTTWQSPEPHNAPAHPITGSAGQIDFSDLYAPEITRPVLRSIPSIEPTASRTTPSWRSFRKRSPLKS